MATAATAHLHRYTGGHIGSCCCFRTAAPVLNTRHNTSLRNFCYGQPIGPRQGASSVFLGITRSYASHLSDLLHLSAVQVDSQAVVGVLGLLVVAVAAPLLYAQAQQAENTQLGLVSDGASWAPTNAAAPAAPVNLAAKAAAASAAGVAGGAGKPAHSDAYSPPPATSSAAAATAATAAGAAGTGLAPSVAATAEPPAPVPSSQHAAPSTLAASTTTAAAPAAGTPCEQPHPSQRLLAAPTSSSSQAQRLLPDHASSQPHSPAPRLLARPVKRLSLPSQATPRTASSHTSGTGSSGSSHATTGNAGGATAAQAPTAAETAAPAATPRAAAAAAAAITVQPQQQEEEEELDPLTLAAALLAKSGAASSSSSLSPPPSVLTSLDEAADALLLPQEASVGPGELSLAVGLLRAAGQDEGGIGPATGHGLPQRLHQLLRLLDERPDGGVREGSNRGDEGQGSSNSSGSVMDSFWGEEDDWEDVRAALMAVGLDQSLDEEEVGAQQDGSRAGGGPLLLDAADAQRLVEVLAELRGRQGAAAAPGATLEAAVGVGQGGVEGVGGLEESSEEAAWWEAVGVAYQAVWEEARVVRQQA